MIKEEGKITYDLIMKLTKWRHSGFNIDNGTRISRDDEKGRVSGHEPVTHEFHTELHNFILQKHLSLSEIKIVINSGKSLFAMGEVLY